MYFPSKKDVWITVLLWGIALIGVIIPIITGNPLSSLFVLPLALILLWFWFRTGYKINADQIKIRYGPIRQTIHIKDIRTINKTKNPLTAAPALSMDRIQIYCSKYDVVTISPIDQQRFIQMLLEINSDIALDKSLNTMIQKK